MDFFLYFIYVINLNMKMLKQVCCVIAAEVRGNSNDTLLAGSLAKALCCILTLESIYMNDAE